MSIASVKRCDDSLKTDNFVREALLLSGQRPSSPLPAVIRPSRLKLPSMARHFSTDLFALLAQYGAQAIVNVEHCRAAPRASPKTHHRPAVSSFGCRCGAMHFKANGFSRRIRCQHRWPPSPGAGPSRQVSSSEPSTTPHGEATPPAHRTGGALRRHRQGAQRSALEQESIDVPAGRWCPHRLGRHAAHCGDRRRTRGNARHGSPLKLAIAGTRQPEGADHR
jgi:hypothetical protein